MSLLLSTIFATALYGQTPPKAPAAVAIALERKFTKGDKAAYTVKAYLFEEQRQPGLDTFLPSEESYDYNFTTEVKEVKADGFAQMLYLRPKMVMTTGDTYQSEAKSTDLKVNYKLLMDVSPINEITNVIDLAERDKEAKEKAKKKPEKKSPAKKKPGSGVELFRALGMTPTPAMVLQDLGQYQSEVFRLALFLGSLESSLDFNPRFPIDEIKPGQKWKKTVGYSPQVLKGEKAKSAVQRLDYNYSYKGLMEVDGKQIQRIEAELALDSDIAPWFNDAFGAKPEDTGLKSYKLKLNTKIIFDCDPKTMATLKADANAVGSITIDVVGLPAKIETNIKGKTTMIKTK